MLWLMFAAYNERENLANLLPGLSNFLEGKIKDYKILIVDDGSTDSTKNIADSLDKPLPIEIISHEKNKGVGEVFKTGFSAISRLAGQDDLVVVLEADGTSDYTLIPELVRKLEGGMDIVIASRYIKGGAYRNFPLKRHLISHIGNVILSMAFRNKRIKDYTIFFRGYRVELLKKALSQYKDGFITSNTFLANTEALINLTKLTDKIDEVPFVYSYEVKIGKSKMPLLKTLFDYIKFLLTKRA
ncbi:MAG: glycosyltransferase [Candidatus Omnitrophica bacterium]|nr:glycosyltransferase [Candidatus Omnitrophota bacterium]